MTVSSPNVIEIKLDRLIDDMRLLRSQMIACDRQLKEIEAYLKPGEQQPESKSRPWFAAAASATARTVLILVCSRGSNRRSLALSGDMTRNETAILRVNEYTPSGRVGHWSSRNGAGSNPRLLIVHPVFRQTKQPGGARQKPKACRRPASQATKTEKTNGESTPPAITSFSPARSGASSPRK